MKVIELLEKKEFVFIKEEESFYINEELERLDLEELIKCKDFLKISGSDIKYWKLRIVTKQDMTRTILRLEHMATLEIPKRVIIAEGVIV